ncbi:peptidoglycan editing factor PgeF [Piscibacillus salipiscarius]|uniref:Purine nucleoside phosphorylase n=1 Tax=Piscibacillus salipiscarius TaxID=299480 RepID=A0ABW5Q8Y3_9BACI|nr:peptidoglycan editing factor PgeF [Piscibacillus salipiscarius]
MEILQLVDDVLKVTPWNQSKVQAGFSTRKGGVSESPYQSMNLGIHVNDSETAVLKNREIFSQKANTDLSSWKAVNQVHSNNIMDLSKESGGHQYNHHHPEVDADGMITNQVGQVLTAFYADCVPLLFKSKDDHWIGIAHAGWKGTVSEIGPKMVHLFNEKGIDSKNLEVVIGPCISKNNYEVDQRVADHVPEKFHSEVLMPTREGHYLLDLKRLNTLFLVDNGVNESSVYITNYCTFNDEEWLFSHRRDQGKTGRMMAYLYKQ